VDSKEYLTNKSFCPLPWTGFQIDSDGKVRNCICTSAPIGNIKEKPIWEIMQDQPNTKIKEEMLQDKKPKNCEYCYSLEEGKTGTNIISSRVYYLKELKNVPQELYNDSKSFDLHHVDLRWQNSCNFACVYCSAIYSSSWEKELGIKVDRPAKEQITATKEYIFGKVDQIENVYLAGGEPLLMKENEEFLKLLLEKNPNVHIRVNTNLSKTGTKVFDLLCQFKNVHWTVSVESINDEFEYIRYGGIWEDFLTNLDIISKLDHHKLTFNMVWCLFNFRSIFDCIEFFQKKGFHNNSFIITALYGPEWIDSRQLPESVLQSIKELTQAKINQKPGFLLEDGYNNIINHINKPFKKNLEDSFMRIRELDKRRNLDSSKIFNELYNIYQGK
jgi:radical SAM protein with 4Fe4S-binding SPASM domain